MSEARTSQYCRKCYQKGARKIQGLFTCTKCGEENADRNAAFNIAYRALGYISKVGVTVNMPNLKLRTFASVDRNAMMTKEATYFIGGSSLHQIEIVKLSSLSVGILPILKAIL